MKENCDTLACISQTFHPLPSPKTQGGAKLPGYRVTKFFYSDAWCFVELQYGSCFLPPSWRLQFGVG